MSGGRRRRKTRRIENLRLIEDIADNYAPSAATMIAETLNSYSLALGYLRSLVAEVPDGMLVFQPEGAPNHPAWVIGHLVYSFQALGGEIGLAPWLPADWEERYGTGSMPTNERNAYPGKDELLANLGDAERRIRERLLGMTEAELAQPLPDERYRTMFPTVGHAVLHILVGHAAIHVGQLTVWRRAVGLEPLRNTFL